MTKNDDPHDPMSGYRPDMDQYHNVNDDVDEAYRMLGNVIIAVIAIVACVLLLAIWRMLS